MTNSMSLSFRKDRDGPLILGNLNRAKRSYEKRRVSNLFVSQGSEVITRVTIPKLLINKAIRGLEYSTIKSSMDLASVINNIIAPNVLIKMDGENMSKNKDVSLNMGFSNSDATPTIFLQSIDQRLINLESKFDSETKLIRDKLDTLINDEKLDARFDKFEISRRKAIWNTAITLVVGVIIAKLDVIFKFISKILE